MTAFFKIPLLLLFFISSIQSYGQRKNKDIEKVTLSSTQLARFRFIHRASINKISGDTIEKHVIIYFSTPNPRPNPNSNLPPVEWRTIVWPCNSNTRDSINTFVDQLKNAQSKLSQKKDWNYDAGKYQLEIRRRRSRFLWIGVYPGDTTNLGAPAVISRQIDRIIAWFEKIGYPGS